MRSLKRADNRLMPNQKVKGVSSNGIIIVSDARIDDLIGRWLMNYIRVHARGITLETWGCTGESGFDPGGTVGYGPTMWVKSRKGGDVLRDHARKACQRIACRLCWQQCRYQGRGTKRTIFLLVERGGPIGKVLVHWWLPECHQQK